MSKICNNCGKPCEDLEMFCTNCGANLPAPTQPMNQPPMAPNQPPMAPNGFAPQQPPMAQEQPPMAPNGFAPVDPNQPPMAPNQPPMAPNQPPMAPNGFAPVPPMAPKKPFMDQVKDFFIKAKNYLLNDPKGKKFALIGIGAIAAILVAVIVIALAFPSPKATVKRYMKAIEKGNSEKVVSFEPDFYYEDDDDRDDVIDAYDEMFDEMEDFEYEIKDISGLKASEIVALKTTLEWYEEVFDDFDSKHVSGYQKVKVKVSYELDGEDYSDTWNLYLIKYKGQWKIFSGAQLPYYYYN